jgi:uncharacterized protein YndB with AHSA1/START domain
MSTMTAQATQVYSLIIRATPEQVWDAITKPEFTTQYFFGSIIESTFEPGARYCGWSGDRSELFVDGEVIESTPPSRLVTTWRAMWQPDLSVEPASRVTWEIEPAGDGVSKLTVIHDHLEQAPQTALSVANGWTLVVSGLKTVLETGEPLIAGGME